MLLNEVQRRPPIDLIEYIAYSSTSPDLSRLSFVISFESSHCPQSLVVPIHCLAVSKFEWSHFLQERHSRPASVIYASPRSSTASLAKGKIDNGSCDTGTAATDDGSVKVNAFRLKQIS